MSSQRSIRWGAAPFLLLAAWWLWPGHLQADVASRVRGMIVLQVERNGEAWYVHPDTLLRVYLGRPADAFFIMRQHGLGISNANLAKIPVAGSSQAGDPNLRRRMSGRVLIQVERNGEAWYVYPGTLQRHFLGRPADAFQIMTALGLGISNRALAELASTHRLAVPFTAQAPHGLWDFDHDNFCEEASVLMVGRYFQRREIAGPSDAEQALQRLKAWELATFGYHKDTSAAETAAMLRANYGLRVELVRNPSIAQIHDFLDQGQPVIVPLAGSLLNNPNFRNGGPIYHMVVIKGYAENGRFIVNDPGTRFGENYLYDETRIMAAMHDLVSNGRGVALSRRDAVRGQPVMLVVSRP
ncbi:MAG: C39 family peptidase [Candidatus Kerfeldbacteria bacterium]|nr:C39 family peptidase [Candidatus Kerfeldbacteria bacterium]